MSAPAPRPSDTRLSALGQLRSSGNPPTSLPDAVVVLHGKIRVWYHITTSNQHAVITMAARKNPGSGPRVGTKAVRRTPLFPPGPPTDLHVALVRKLKCDGKTDDEIADYFGVATRTIDNWKIASEAFRAAHAQGKQVVIAKCIDALMRIGFGGEPTQTITTVEKQSEISKTNTVDRRTPRDLKAILHTLAWLDPAHWALNLKSRDDGEIDCSAALADYQRRLSELAAGKLH
jgi:hypothetical protein